MDPEKLNDIVKRTDPDAMGVELESQKEAAAQAVQDQEKAQQEYQAKRKERSQRRVGIKTYRDYAAEELKEGGGTLTNMIMKERAREREETRHSAKNPRNILVLLLAGIVVSVAIVIVAFVFILTSNKVEDTAIKNNFVVAAQPLLFSDFRQEIYLPEPTKSRLERAVARDIEQTAIPIGKINHVYFTRDGSINPKELVPAVSFISELSTTVPQEFLRQLESQFMYGYYSSQKNAPFMIFKVRDFARSYASMLEWERDMVRDFANFFTQDIRGGSDNFQDLVLFNLDTRVLLDASGEVIFGYTFLQDRETIVIFDTRNTLQEINTRNLRNPILR